MAAGTERRPRPLRPPEQDAGRLAARRDDPDLALIRVAQLRTKPRILLTQLAERTRCFLTCVSAATSTLATPLTTWHWHAMAQARPL